MENQIKVLWLDDQHEKMSSFKIYASKSGIELEAFTSFEEGFSHLEKNLYQFDVILLDGLFFENKGQAENTENVRGLGKSVTRIVELKSKKVFPWFILSGKTSFTQNENDLLRAYDARCYDKSNPDDIEQLFDDIKTAAANQPVTQIRHKYSRVLEAFNGKYLGVESFQSMIKLIKKAEFSEDVMPQNDFNEIRQNLENLFSRLSKLNLIPPPIYAGAGSINGSSKFLDNKHDDFLWKDPNTVHPTIRLIIKSLLDICQDGSHADDVKLQYRVNNFVNGNKTPYLFSSCMYMLMDVLIWFKGFIDKNPDPEKNKLLWERKPIETPDGNNITTEGIVEQDAQNNYHCNNILLTYKMVKEKGLEKGARVRILKYGSNTNDRTKIFFQYYAKDAERID